MKYEYRIDFRKNSERAYMAAHVNGWLDEICQNLKYKYESWNKDKCKEDALKYSTRSAYYFGSCSSWDRARRNGWLDEICLHMKNVRKLNGYWTIENSIIEAKKYKKSNELKKNSSRAYKIICHRFLS